MKSPPPARGPPATTGVRGGAPSVPTSSNSLHSPAPLLPLLNRQTPEKQAFCGVCPHDFLFSPSRSALYCTISAPFKSQDAYNSASRPSANTVGYLQSAKVTGVDMGSAAFDAIGGAAVNIQDIVPVVGEEEELYTGGFVIMTMTDGGETDESYSYYTAEDAPDGVAGWFDGTGARSTKTFQPGEGFVTSSDYETGKLQTSGIVATDDSVFALGTGINSCGNTTSATLSIEALKVGVAIDEEGNLLSVNEDTEEEIYTGGLVIMTLTDGGETDASYSYFTAEDAPDGVAGWFDGAGDRVSVSFDAGVGFIVSSDYAESYIKLPSAL